MTSDTERELLTRMTRLETISEEQEKARIERAKQQQQMHRDMLVRINTLETVVNAAAAAAAAAASAAAAAAVAKTTISPVGGTSTVVQLGSAGAVVASVLALLAKQFGLW